MNSVSPTMDRTNNQRMSSTSRMSRPGQQVLTIRTANPSSHSAMQHHSPLPQGEQPKYPLAIPTDKQSKAAKLFRQYKMEQKLSLSREPTSAISNDGHLNVPSSQSITSFQSSRHQRQPSMSDYDGITDFSSVVSFDGGDESPSSLKAKAQGEMRSHTGQKIRIRQRKKLSPVQKAKAALIRYLGSCKVCRDRKVPCPLEHHDIDSLDRHPPPTPQLTSSQQSQFSTSSSGSSQATAKSIPGLQHGPSGAASQADALFGIGGNPQLLQMDSMFDNGILDISSPSGMQDDSYSSFSSSRTLDFSPSVPTIIEEPDPYGTYKDGMMFPIGSKKGYMFACLHFKPCPAQFHTEEELQTHFETAHFAYTRIDPACRYVCAACLALNDTQAGFCSYCNMENSIQVWIYGNYIKLDVSRREGPNGGDIQTLMSPAITFDTTSYTSDTFDSQWNMNLDGGDFGGGGRFTGYDFQGGGGNIYGGAADGGFGYGGGYTGFGFGGSPSQGGSFTGNSPNSNFSFNTASPTTFNLSFTQAKTYTHWLIPISLFLFLVATISLGLTHDWIITKFNSITQPILNEFANHLPLVGFLVIVASSITCFSLKTMSSQRVQQSQRLEWNQKQMMRRPRVSLSGIGGSIPEFRLLRVVADGSDMGRGWLL